MNDFRLEVFLSVARHLSFTKASQELHISQPAISKHIGELEHYYGIQLFIRKQNKIELSHPGKVFQMHAEELHQKYRALAYQMSQLTQNHRGKLTIGASTTIAQYVLPAIMAKFKKEYPEIELSLISENSEHIEKLVANGGVDFGLVEGASHNPAFKYSQFIEDELVLVTAPANAAQEEVSIETLTQLPIVVREDGSGTLEVLDKLLKKHHIKISNLNVFMQLGSSEAIKRFVRAGNGYAIISIAAIMEELKRDELTIVEIENVNIKREFSFIMNKGAQDKLVEQFIHFAKCNYNQKL